MIKMLEPMSGEIAHEAATTKRVLQRVPADKLTWKPHPKSMSLGQLAMHVATIPAGICRLAPWMSLKLTPRISLRPSPRVRKRLSRLWMPASRRRRTIWAE